MVRHTGGIRTELDPRQLMGIIARPEPGSVPVVIALRDIVEVKEQRYTYWVSGAMISDPLVTVEMSFEGMANHRPLPGTELTYLGMWRRGFPVIPRRRSLGPSPSTKTIFEYQLGTIVHKPTLEDYAAYVMPLISKLKGYRMVNGLLLKV